MRQIRAFVFRLGGFFSKDRWENDLAAEIESNLQLQVEDNLRAGMNLEEARRAALIKFGHIESTKEIYRDRKSLPLLEGLTQDLRYAVRTIRKSPVFALVAILSLALGIGANTAIFSLFDAVLLRELPIDDPQRLFSLSQSGFKTAKMSANIRYGLFKQFESDRRILSGTFTFHGQPRANVVIGQQAEVTDALMVSSDYFRVLGVQPRIGRAFDGQEENVAVISHRYWQRRFAGDPSVVGRDIRINDAAYTVIGVTPPEFFGVIVGTWTDVTIPTRPAKDEDTIGWVMGRLAQGVTEQQAVAALSAHAQAWMASHGARERPLIALQPASRGMSFLRAQFSKPLHVLMGMVALVLLMACANVAGLLIARASARQQEIAVRLGLGASRGRVVRQLVTESILLSLIGGCAGLVFASWSADTIARLVSTVKDPVGLDLGLDVRVFAFALLVSTITGIVFGLVPALQGTRVDLVSALKDAARSTSGAGRSKLRQALVVGQIALAVLLVAGAALFTRTLSNLKTLDTGFRRDSVLLMSLEPGAIGYREQRVAQLYEQILDQVERVPGVRSATLLRNSLLSNQSSFTSIVVPGREARPEDELELGGFKLASATRSFAVGPRFLETMGMRLIEGRDFTRADRAVARQVAVVNETFARHFFPGESALGKRFGFGPDAPNAVEIVGVMKDAKHARLLEAPVRSIYIACLQDPGCWRETTLKIRTSINPSAVAPTLRRAIVEVAPNLPVYNVTTMQRMFDDAVVTERTLAGLSGFFGSLALLLASIGLYGLLSYSVERRRSEIGVRMALGARSGDVLAMVFKETAVLIVAGCVLGLPATLIAGRWIAGFLYGLTPADPLTLALTMAALVAVPALSAWLPARRAARMDPMTALRHE